jgi:AcrR family transcriptional regulator
MLRGSAARYMQPTVKKAAKADGPLNVDSWISAAMLVLSKKGIESVRVEPLAKMLGVTKGSFYWHFNDRRALLDAMLQSWRQRATLAIIERMERGKPDPADRLRALIALPQKQASRSVDGAEVEASMRLWARTDPKAAATIREIDRLRLDYIASLLEATKRHPGESRASAVLVYAFILAEAALGPEIDPATYAECERLLLTRD